MGDSYVPGGNYHSKIVDIDDTDYLVQGRVEDPIVMFRSVDELLECERDNAQRMLARYKYGDEVLEE